MTTATMTEINRKVETLLGHHPEIGELLIRELGVADVSRFLSQFTQGSGDYTAERHQWLGDLSLDDIRRDIEDNAGKSRSSRGKEPDSSVKAESVGAACDEVDGLLKDGLLKKDQRDRAVRVAEYVLRHEISGPPDDFQRLGKRLAEAELHRLAAKIVLRGLEHFPEDLRLLSSGIAHLELIGDADTLRKARERYRRIVSETSLEQASENPEGLLRSIDNLPSNEKLDRFPLEFTKCRIDPRQEGTMEELWGNLPNIHRGPD
uniref:Uncharacterized protein n=1 Tax=Candidatus Kentrum sp. DK TaxID=2126562 RepID=A0A450SJ40_9GAMM|nr:MAG: hypothetical protein BECKDK2373B_GA0170837_104225 [Candidatus Kentron sp. DK]